MSSADFAYPLVPTHALGLGTHNIDRALACGWHEAEDGFAQLNLLKHDESIGSSAVNVAGEAWYFV